MQEEIKQFCDSLIKNPKQAKAICQRTFEQFGKVTPHFQTRALLFSIARNLCLDELLWLKTQQEATASTLTPVGPLVEDAGYQFYKTQKSHLI